MQPPFGPATLEPILISALYNVLPPATFVVDALSWLLPTPSPFILNNADHVAALTCTSLTPDADDALRRSCTQLLLHLVTSEALLQQQPQAVQCLIVSWRAELAKWRPDTSLIQALHSARLVERRPGLDDLFDQHFVRMADTFLVAARLHWGPQSKKASSCIPLQTTTSLYRLRIWLTAIRSVAARECPNIISQSL
mmetsp:Transcript_98180/g.165365  ORF Transcript_98180/g.165365 Transcript_98180/m.165365 type:complete len:196 (+) Transcript_98180:1396-1983(+)